MKNMSIRRKLYILILIVLVPLCALQIMSILSRYEKAVENELLASREFAESTNTALINHFNYLWELEEIVGRTISDDERFPNPDRIGEILHGMKCDHLEDLTWIGPDGIVVASTVHGSEGLDLHEQDYFQQVLQGQERVVSDLMVAEVTGKQTILVVRGLYQQDRLVGVMAGGLKMDTLESILPKGRLAKTGAFGFADRNGMFVFHSGSEVLADRQVNTDSPVWQALKGNIMESRRHKFNLTGENRMGVSIPFSEVGWATFATVSVAEVMDEIIAATLRDIIILIIMAAISFWAAIKVGDQILRPVKKLQQGAIAISQGNLSARARIEGNDELAITGQIFDQMAERIQKLETGREIFLQTAAHELRNPMAGVKGMLALIRRKITSGKTVDQVEEKFAIMEKEIDRLSNLLNQILEAFRLQREEGLLSLNLQFVNVIDILQTALIPFQHMMSQCNFIFELKTRRPLVILADVSRLEDVFRNLFSNANKYSPHGGEVIVTAAKVGDTALVSVKDSGIGIPIEQINHVFECFHRGRNLKTNDPGGMGLGLYICEKIVLSHGGTIWVESVEGEGSTFFVQIPLAQETADTAAV